jgi:hypothetical protein
LLDVKAYVQTISTTSTTVFVYGSTTLMDLGFFNFEVSGSFSHTTQDFSERGIGPFANLYLTT